MDTIVVTRHRALVTLLRKWKVVTGDVQVYQHVTEQDVAGKHVIGVLPIWLAASAASYTEVPVRAPREMRGVELSLDELRLYARQPVTYHIQVMGRHKVLPGNVSRDYSTRVAE